MPVILALSGNAAAAVSPMYPHSPMPTAASFITTAIDDSAGFAYDEPVDIAHGPDFGPSAIDTRRSSDPSSVASGSGRSGHLYDPASKFVAPRSIPGISDDVLQQADDVIRRVDGGLEPPTGVHPNGRQFRNDGRGGGQVLPELTTDGTSIRYNEWDVNPPGPGGRDAVRVVTGSDGSAWFTGDHYTTFTQIRPGS